MSYFNDKPILIEKLRSKEGGILLIDKPLTWTSFDVVKKLRCTFNIKKIGHAGTLDPLATGLLLIATNQKLKNMVLFQGLDKEYEGVIILGQTTASYDLETLPENPKEISHLTVSIIEETAKSFTGFIEQIPPIYSSIKIKGKKAYEYARQQKKVELKSRQVHIHNFKIEVSLPQVHFVVSCSKGTYIRSLAHDFGKTLGVGAYLKSLKRTAIGDYKLEDAYSLDEIISCKI